MSEAQEETKQLGRGRRNRARELDGDNAGDDRPKTAGRGNRGGRGRGGGRGSGGRDEDGGARRPVTARQSANAAEGDGEESK